MQSQFVYLYAEIRHNELLTEAARLRIIDQVSTQRAAPGVVIDCAWRRCQVRRATAAIHLRVDLRRLLTATRGKGSPAALKLSVDSLSIEA
jgi:hypothetical protein